MRRNRTSGWRTAGSLGLLLAFVAGVAVLTPVTAQEPEEARGNPYGEWRYQSGDAWGTRYSPLDQIDADNFEDLEVAWVWRGDNFGPHPLYLSRSTPSYIDGILYTVAGYRRTVAAIDPSTGETLWTYREPNTRRWEESMRASYGKGVQSNLVAQCIGCIGRSPALEVDQCVGQGDVVLADELVVIKDVLLELGAVLGEVAGRACPSGEDDIQEVRGTSHHPATGPCPVGHHVAPAFQVFDGPGDEVRQPDRITGCRRGEGQFFPKRRVVLHVVQGCNRLHSAAQGRVSGYVLHKLPVNPNFAGAVAQALDIFLSRACWHCPPPRRAGCTDQRRLRAG